MVALRFYPGLSNRGDLNRRAKPAGQQEHSLSERERERERERESVYKIYTEKAYNLPSSVLILCKWCILIANDI